MKILICADYSEAGKHVLQQAKIFIAPYTNIELHVCTVIDMSVLTVAGMYNSADVMDALVEQANQTQVCAQKVFESIDIHFSSEVGYPSTVILQKANDVKADLLIVGTHGKTGIGRVLMGSVAENVLRHTSCNTLVIPVKHLAVENNQ